MRTRRIARWPWLLLAGLLLHTTLAAQEPPIPSQPQFPPDVRGRLIQAARSPALAPWQREFMLEAARGKVGARALGASPAQRGAAQRPVDIAADDGSWIRISPIATGNGNTAIYDPVRDRMLVFGGYDLNTSSFLNDVWELSLSGDPVWTVFTPAGSRPAARYLPAAIYDPVRDRMVVFGGTDDIGLRNDVWVLSLGNHIWSELSPTGTPPPARSYSSATYDPVRDRMVVFGGYGGSSYRNDVWALSLAGSPAWSELTPAGTPPSGRYGHTAIHDPVRDRVLMFGGYDASHRNDVWALSLAGSPEWNELTPAGTAPTGRYEHTAIYDLVRDRMVVLGGTGGSLDNDVWALSLTGSPAWSEITPAGTPMRYGHQAIYDPVRDRMVVFGGYDGNSAGIVNDVLSLSLAGSPAWSELAPAETPPTRRYSHTAIYDALRERMVVFGGYDGSYRNDVWELSPNWSELTLAGTPPSGRYGHAAIYDPLRDRMVVFGGYDGSYRNDVWTLPLAGSPAWTELAPAGTPPTARFFHTAIYDPTGDRMLVFGGHDGSSYRNDVWVLSLAGNPAWSELTPAGPPTPGRYGHRAIYDPVRDRMLVFGGLGFNGDDHYFNDVWALSLAGSPTWSEIAPAGTPPAGRFLHTAIYDPVRDRMLVFGGFGGAVYLNDALALSLTGTPAWSALIPAGTAPFARAEQTAIYDPVRDRMLVFGGVGHDGVDYVSLNDAWALEWGTPLSVPDDHALLTRFALATPRPNPSRGSVTLDFTVPQSSHVSLVIYDMAGRRIRKLVDATLSPGPHSTGWDDRDESGRAVPAGIYLVRLTAPHAQVVSKAVVTEVGSR